MKRYAFFITINVLFLICICKPIYAQSDFSFLDQEIVGIKVGEDHVEQLNKLYGNGVNILSGEGRCYFSLKKQEYIIFYLCEDLLICGAVLSKNDTLWKECRGKAIPIELKTEKNIKLGDSKHEVEKKYGSPTKKSLGSDEIELLEYYTDYDETSLVRISYDAIFKFREDSLIEVYIHNGP